jgi:glutamate synthase (NADPH/NADH) small chain
MEEEGVIFKCNANVGVNVNVNDLLKYHAVDLLVVQLFQET